MTRARILADYVAGGTTATEFDYLDGLGSTAVGINDTQTLANKTLASTTTFPAGHVTNVFRFSDTSTADMNIQTATTTIGSTPFSFSATSGRHYCIVGGQFVAPYRYSGSHSMRFQYSFLYYGTTSRSQLDTTVDTLLFKTNIGRQSESSTGEYTSYGTFAYFGNFTAGSTATHYVYTAYSCTDSNTRARAYANATYPHNAIIYEILP